MAIVKIDLEDLMPDDTPAYMLPAWLGCLHWAIGDQGVLDAFRTDTGNQWRPGKTGLDKMIDQATGADREFIVAFVKWMNVHVWGPVDGNA